MLKLGEVERSTSPVGVNKMLEKVKETFVALYYSIWEESSWKYKVSVSFGLAIGLWLGTHVVHSILAKEGCPASMGISDILLNGFLGIMCVIFFFIFSTVLIGGLLDLPSGVIKWRRKRCSIWSGISTDKLIDFGKVAGKVVLFIVCVFLMSLFAGYTWWIIFC